MLYFLDTSVLLKRYHLEEGSKIVIDLFEDEENTLVICSLSLAETISALNKRRNRKDISNEDFNTARFKFFLDHSMGRLGIIDIHRSHIIQASELLLHHNLSANDALILTCALTIQPESPIFVCSDVRSGLLRAAEDCHLSTLNPLSP